MNYREYCDKLQNKLLFDQNKLKDKQEELAKLTEELNQIEQQCTEREKLNSQINEKIKLIEILHGRVKANFDEFPTEINDLEWYLKQVLHNKHKFEVPINQFKRILDNSFASLNKEIHDKVDFVKSKYKEITDKLQTRKEYSKRLEDESLAKYEQLKNSVSIENQNCAKLEEDIETKRNLIQEYTVKISETDQQNKQLELKTESILKENQSINKKIVDLHVQFKKADEDKRSIESKIKMQDELIDCTKLMIEELENNINSNLNYKKYKDEYDQLEDQIKKLEQELNDRHCIHEMKRQCAELKDKKVEQINQIVHNLKAIETRDDLSDEEKNAQYELVINEIEKEIEYLENELDGKGLLSQLGNAKVDSSTTNDALDDSQKTKDDHLNKFEYVPEELMSYVYDDEAILFETQSDYQLSGDKATNYFDDETVTDSNTAINNIDNLSDLDSSFGLTGSTRNNFGLDQFLNPTVLNELLDDPFNSTQSNLFNSDTNLSTVSQPNVTQSNSNTQLTQTDLSNTDSNTTKRTAESIIADSSPRINSQPIKTPTKANTLNLSISSSNSQNCFKSPQPVIKRKEHQTKDDKRRKHPDDGSNKDLVKRKRQN